MRDRALAELLYGAGLRVSEAVGSTARRSTSTNGFVRCIGKGTKERVVPIGGAPPRRSPLPRPRAAASSTAGTGPSSSSTRGAARSPAPAPS